MKNEKYRNRPQPKNFYDYAMFCIKTNNVHALSKGLYKIVKIYVYCYARWLLRCHYCRKKQNSKLINLNQAVNKLEILKKQKNYQNSS